MVAKSSNDTGQITTFITSHVALLTYIFRQYLWKAYIVMCFYKKERKNCTFSLMHLIQLGAVVK